MFRKVVLGGSAILLVVSGAASLGAALVVPVSGETMFYAVVIGLCSLLLGVIAKSELPRTITVRVRPQPRHPWGMQPPR